MSKETTNWVEYPEIDGFEVHFKFLSREDLLKIRNKSTVLKLNKKTRAKEEVVDNNRFIANYAEATILGWRGLKIKNLPDLLPMDVTGMNGNTEVVYDSDEAVELLKNSTEFDEFVTETLNDFQLFTNKKAEEDVKN